MTKDMSGEIFHPPDSLEDLDVTRWNPLMCYLCNEKYEEPCILGCFHSFCLRCLRGRNVDGKMTCPLCGSSTQIKDGEELPPSDRLMKFLVESTGDEKEKCANCDIEFEQMFFCNTCDQPLCEACREETHKAKMFARHDIVVLSKRTKEIHRECAIHQEPYILFSTERKTMLCINCFRDMKVESRSYCVDLETAYSQGCKKLDQSMMAIKDLQNSVRDAILLLKVLLEEIEQNADKEKTAVTELYNELLEKITETKTSLIQEVDRQYESKEKAFKAELVSLSTLLPTLHTHLVTSAAFCSSANRFEFLDLVYVLMERLKTIIQLQHPLHPSQGSQIITDFKSMFAKCLEPLLFPPKKTSVITSSSAISLVGSSFNLTTPSYSTARFVPTTTVSNTSPSHTLQYPQRRQTGYNSIKYKLIESKGVFAEHCTEFNTSHRELNSSTEKLKTLIQELQRDLTVRRCLAKMTVVAELEDQIKTLQQGLDEHFCKNEQKQQFLEKHWEESVQRIATEQELYQAQLHDIIRLKQESEQLSTILTRMSSFVSSIASVTERIAPKLIKTSKDSDNATKITQLFEQINTMTPDSQHRVDAIRTAQEERETLTANRPNPLDEELIKTKGMLKAPSARKEVGRKDSTKRNSREIKELVILDEKDAINLQQCNADNEVTNITEKNDNEKLSNLSSDSSEIQSDGVDKMNETLSKDGQITNDQQKDNDEIKTEIKSDDHHIVNDKQVVNIGENDSKDSSNQLSTTNQDIDKNVQKSFAKEVKSMNDNDQIDIKNGCEKIQSSEKLVQKSEKVVQSSEKEVKGLEKLVQNSQKEVKSSEKIICSENVVQSSENVVQSSEKEVQSSEKEGMTEEGKEANVCEKLCLDTETFSLPKDFVASTVKDFENQNSPEKGDDSSVKRTRRSRKNKQSHAESCDHHSNDIDNANTQKLLPKKAEIPATRSETKKSHNNSNEKSIKISESNSTQPHVENDVGLNNHSNDIQVEATIQLQEEQSVKVKDAVKKISGSVQ